MHAHTLLHNLRIPMKALKELQKAMNNVHHVLACEVLTSSAKLLGAFALTSREGGCKVVQDHFFSEREKVKPQPCDRLSKDLAHRKRYAHHNKAKEFKQGVHQAL